MGLNDGQLQVWALAVGAGSQVGWEAPLTAGVHLRWALTRELGLPWGGFYILRRPAAGLDASGLNAAAGQGQIWQLAAAPTQPIALPVAHADYPAGTAVIPLQGKAPLTASKAYGIGRVQGPMKDDLTGGFDSLYELLTKLVADGPAGTPMRDRELPATLPEKAAVEDPLLCAQSILDLAMLGVAYPDYAQLLGLYAVDAAVYGAIAFDYVVVADCENAFGCDATQAVAWANGGMPHWAGVQARLVANIATAPSGILPSPMALSAYTLPVTSTPIPGQPNALQPFFAAAGLVWDCAPMPGVQGDAVPTANLFQLARAMVPISKPAPDMLAEKFKQLQAPNVWHLAGGNRAFVGDGTSVPAEWPRLEMQYVDSNLQQGWYAWRVRAMDWFGRVSGPSALADWRLWSVAAGTTDELLDPSRTMLVDKAAPPAPVGLDVQAVDPKDPWHFDAVWAETNQAIIGTSAFGARVRWQWPWAAQRQAPDLNEFRVYLRAGAGNTFAGKVTAKVPAVDETVGNAWVTVAVKLPKTLNAGDVKGAACQLGVTSATVEAAVAVDGGVRVLLDLPVPHTVASLTVGQTCALVIPRGHAAWVDPGKVQVGGWVRADVVDMKQGLKTFEIYRGNDGVSYCGVAAMPTAKGFTLDGTSDLDAVFAGQWQLMVAPAAAGGGADLTKAQVCGISGIDLDTRTVKTEPLPGKVAGPLLWFLGQSSLDYECYLPLDKVVPEPGADVGKTWFEVAVTAADDQKLTADWLVAGAFANHIGNESTVAGPRRGERIRRAAPEVVEAAWGDQDMMASKADVDGFSYVTLRWKAGPVAVKIQRASALGVFRADWGACADGVGVKKQFSGKFGDAEKGHYGKLTNAEVRALAGKYAGAFAPVTAVPLADADCWDRIGPDSSLGYEVDPVLRAYTDRLDGLVDGKYLYRVDSVDAGGNVAVGKGVSPVVGVVAPRFPATPVIREVRIGTVAFQTAIASAEPWQYSEILGKSGGLTVTVFWTQADAADVVGWYLKLIGPDSKAVTTSVVDAKVDAVGVWRWTSEVLAAGAWCIRMAAKGKDGATSAHSEEVQFVVPAMWLPPAPTVEFKNASSGGHILLLGPSQYYTILSQAFEVQAAPTVQMFMPPAAVMRELTLDASVTHLTAASLEIGGQIGPSVKISLATLG